MRSALAVSLYLLALPLICQTVYRAEIQFRKKYPDQTGSLTVDRNLQATLYVHDSILQSMQPKYSVRIDDMPESLKESLLFQEDQAFFDHRGYHIREMKNAFLDFVLRGRLRGASTITQQLARTLFLSRRRTIARKMQEIRVARILENALSKDQILELYLNHVYWGKNQYGIGSASRYYFRKKPADLTARESVFLVSLLPDPDVFKKGKKGLSPAQARRQKRLLKHLERIDIK